uniref:Docking protein 7 n=1 Tax=Astyanax mexicanus TaxID=7994 RepID=A0A3B1JK49_ASTMX
MTDSVVAEGHVKLRDGKKWKSRWVVLRKPSPVADCLVLHVSKERGAKEKSSVVLEHICGLEAGSSGEGVAFTLTILCLNQTVQLGFDSKDALLPWDLRLHYHLGEVHSFNVTVLPGTKLESGPATLHFCNSLLVIARDVPPVIIGQWNLLDLRRYGPVTNGFVFEGGTRCGYWAGVFFLSCAEGEQISFLFDCVVRGLSPSRGPFGLKPLLPEPSTTAASVEERLNHEAEELEKRLSLLSHSTASSFSSSVAGDDRSISGSSDNSDTSHSDSSIGSRLTLWAEPLPTTSTESSFTTASRIASHGEDKLSVNVAGVPRVPSKPSCSRRLQEIGRQGSSDSGIATGSHSSYSGSFSSYTGSLDIGSPKEEYGSLFSLPSLSNPEKHLCTCPTSHNHEYQVPSSLRYLYDTPRSLLEPPGSSVTVQSKEQSGAATKEPAGFTSRERTDETVKEQTEASAASFSIPNSPRESTLFLTHNHRPEGTQKVVQGCQGASCAETHSECLICSPPPAASRSLFTTCPVCGGLKKAPFPQSGSTLQPGVPGKKSASINTDAMESPTKQHETESSAPSSMQDLPCGSSETNQTLQERSPESYMDSLNDLLVHYSPGKSDTVSVKPSLLLSHQPGHYCPPGNDNQRSVRTSQYERMLALALASPTSPASTISHTTPSHRASHSSIYENCLQCRKGQGGCMLPKATPPENRCSLIQPETSEQPETSISNKEATEEDKKQRSHGERGRMDPSYEIMEGRATDRSSEMEEKSRYELMGSCGQQRSPQETEGVFVFPPEGSGVIDRPKGDTVTYVNIPVSPTSKKQLHYMELELQEHGTTIRGKGSTKYAQIDITATETAHRVGTQHALGREEGLQRLEQWRRGGAPQ